MTLVSGSAYVLIAQVPKAGDRWTQVHFNRDIADQFFRLRPGDNLTASLERVAPDRTVVQRTSRPLVFAEKNKNPKVEFDFAGRTAYPTDGVPLLLILELAVRQFRYLPLFPGQTGYDEMLALNAALPKIGRGLRRGITTLDEVELRWPGCPLRG